MAKKIGKKIGKPQGRPRRTWMSAEEWVATVKRRAARLGPAHIGLLDLFNAVLWSPHLTDKQKVRAMRVLVGGDADE